MKVLIVDDEPRVRSMAAAVLSKRGFEVVEAEDGSSALGKAHEFGRELDALLTDIDMPGMTGIDLAKTLSLEFPFMPVVFISGHGMPEGMSELPGSIFIRKPFRAAELVQALDHLMNRRPA